MGLLPRPYCSVNLTDNRSFSVDPRHYESLKDEVETGETGWRELDLFEHPSGKALIRVQDIVDLGYFPQDWCEARQEQERERKLQAKIDGKTEVGFLGEEVRRVMQRDATRRQLQKAQRQAPREYLRLTAVYRPLVEAALHQPNPTPALRAAVSKIASELDLL